MDGMIAWMDCRGGAEGKNQALLELETIPDMTFYTDCFTMGRKNDARVPKNQKKGNMTFQKKVGLDFIKKIKEKITNDYWFLI